MWIATQLKGVGEKTFNIRV